MILPSYVELLAAAEGLTVLDQESGTLRPFKLNREQRRILRKALRTRRLVVGKGRQVGCSTVVAFLMTMIAVRNPGLPMAIVADQQDNANSILGKIKHWLTQMGVTFSGGVESITLENGAIIDALTSISPAEGGESKTGRSRSYGFIHATEMSFWRSAQAVWTSLTRTALKTAIFIVESTGAPGDTLFRELYESPKGWDRLFIGIEQHEAYRAPPETAPTFGISDETFAQLQADYGFTRRDSAAWWYVELTEVAKGDTFRMLREAPIKPEHMFLYQEGQYIRKWTIAVPPPRVAGPWDVYVEDADEPIIIGVDTSHGLSADASALAFVGWKTGRLLRTYRRNDISIPDYIEHIRGVVAEFKPIATVIESNGCGIPVWGVVRNWPEARAVEQYSKGKSAQQQDGELHVRRATIRNEIESGRIPIGGHLLMECKSNTINKLGKFEGPDDVISALSFAWKWREANPYRESAVQERDPNRFSLAHRLRKRDHQTW
jgi:hypothetical protein